MSGVAVVTGGGRGIGAATARALAAEGYAVCVAARTAREVGAIAEELNGAGHRAVAQVVDVTDPDSVAALATAVAGTLGTADVLVNNAGVSHAAPLHHQTLEDWDRMFAVNARGTFLCTKAFVPGMLDRERGRVINVASVAGLSAGRYISAYAAAKHAVIGFTRAIAAEVAARGVTVNAVCPGYVDTDMTRQSIARIQEKTGKTREDALDAILALSPQGRLITPEEVAETIIWLCGDGARGMNGQALVIDGGELRR